MARSLKSRVVERIIKKRGTKEQIADPEKFKDYLRQKQLDNSKRYVMPEEIRKEYGFVEQHRNGMDCYVLTRNKGRIRQKQILYLHGGGYFNQPLHEHWRFLYQLAGQMDVTITVPIYPKAPHHRYTEAFNRVLPLYLEMRSRTAAQDMVVMGDSAGGGFSLALAQLLLQENLPQPGNIILLSPWLDLSMNSPLIPKLEPKDPMLAAYGMREMGRIWAGREDVSHFLLSPLRGPLQGLGRISVFVGTREILLADARALKKRADRLQVPINYFEYDKMNHVFPVYPIPEAKQALRQIAALIQNS
ncbi:alpha/beta hydrolase fold domain-containing protein [Planococcus lenghuensis]|uniref:Alpha/beta hydrolase fold-3 domain-containing protein n=1 Tax=Planococcus lenghuensis TaxID=2213202 RepID=A0A1Q2KWF6_9BACL|nr:alpha/beta hydrolase [Planococcus lenghuensis]AQQ52521.1 hypothetical protein B0X71_05040 [Planococcus lenghuensis]